jgi:hypothetical protein
MKTSSTPPHFASPLDQAQGFLLVVDPLPQVGVFLTPKLMESILSVIYLPLRSVCQALEHFNHRLE